MIENIFKDLFKIEIPLSQNPLKSINSYVIKGLQRNLIIDTGMNTQECSTVMLSALKELEVDLKKTDIFITHMHADHMGLIGVLVNDETKVFCSQTEIEQFRSTVFLDEILNNFSSHGFPENDLKAVTKYPGDNLVFIGSAKFTGVTDGDVIKIGDYSLRCVQTPGHTKGHMCLYDPGKKILISGDHILGDITPNISLFSQKDGNPLQSFLESLNKVYNFEVEIVLPGHRNIFNNLRGRIDELKRHHQERSEKIISILEQGRSNAYNVASKMSWQIVSPSWEHFPIPQKCFATGETIAHLKQLEENEEIICLVENNIRLYSL